MTQGATRLTPLSPGPLLVVPESPDGRPFDVPMSARRLLSFVLSRATLAESVVAMQGPEV